MSIQSQLNSRVVHLANNALTPDQIKSVQAHIIQGVQDGSVASYIGVPLLQDLNTRLTQIQSAPAMAQAMAQQPPIAQQVVQQSRQDVMGQSGMPPMQPPMPPQAPQGPQGMAQPQAPQGITAAQSNLPTQYAGGGIVAFDGGGTADSGSPVDFGVDPRGGWDDIPFWQKIQTLEGSSNTAVSPKGAVSTMQVMPGTLKDPGFGVLPAQNNSLAEAQRVGRDYSAALLKKYGNERDAAAAYNMGPGAYDRWLKSGANINKMPKETQKYLANYDTKFGTPTSQAPTILSQADAGRKFQAMTQPQDSGGLGLISSAYAGGANTQQQNSAGQQPGYQYDYSKGTAANILSALNQKTAPAGFKSWGQVFNGPPTPKTQTAPGITALPAAAPAASTPATSAPGTPAPDTGNAASPGGIQSAFDFVNQFYPDQKSRIDALMKNLPDTHAYANDMKSALKDMKDNLSEKQQSNVNNALIQAGLAMMAGTSRYAAVNIGAGGLAGLQAYAQGKKDITDLQKDITKTQIAVDQDQEAGDWKQLAAHVSQLDLLNTLGGHITQGLAWQGRNANMANRAGMAAVNAQVANATKAMNEFTSQNKGFNPATSTNTTLMQEYTRRQKTLQDATNKYNAFLGKIASGMNIDLDDTYAPSTPTNPYLAAPVTPK